MKLELDVDVKTVLYEIGMYAVKCENKEITPNEYEIVCLDRINKLLAVRTNAKD